ELAALPPAGSHHQDQTVWRSIGSVHRLRRRDRRFAPLPGAIHDPSGAAAQHQNLLLIRIKFQSFPHKLDDIFWAVLARRFGGKERLWTQDSARVACTQYA